ncbi:MAG: enoyl-CoA hydratase/isomerase family protein [Chloroflexi bacterium]|nr:enoyl-CoA hydratase/isomerase family protein [Chloroflexota bacterium]
MDFQNILLERGDQVATLTLNRPDQMNPLDRATVKEMLAAIRECDADDQVRIVVITGRGRGFSAGGDLKSYVKLYRDGPAFERFVRDFQAMCTSIERSAKPFIAAVNGYCVAGGLELMLSCDLVFAADSARIGDGHLNFGQLPGGGGSQRLPRAIGALRAKQLLFSGELLPAGEAERIGLVNKVFPVDQLMASTREYCAMMLTRSPLALKGAKYLVNQGLQTDLHAGIELEVGYVYNYATTSHDAIEGLMAFAEKRRPQFKGT